MHHVRLYRRIGPLLPVLILSVVGPLSAQEKQWPDPIANHVLPYQATGLTHGPMLGQPAAESIRIWVRTDEPRDFRILYGQELPLRPEGQSVSGKTREARDNTGYVDLEGLEPDTRYYYAVVVDGELPDLRIDHDDPWPSFRTLPDATSRPDSEHNPEGLFNFRFSFGACASQQPERSGGHYGSPPAFRTLLQEHGDEVRFHIMNGDFIYEELRDGQMSGYRANFRRYLHRGRSVSNLYRRLPGLFMFDDHEVGGDVQGPGDVGLTGGRVVDRDKALVPWYEYAGWANFRGPHRGRLRRGQAQVEQGGRVLYDPEADFSGLDPENVSTIHLWKSSDNRGVYGLEEVIDANRLRVRPAFRADEEGAAYSIGTHHYFDRRVGNCHFFFIDTRSERGTFSYEDRESPERFILGEQQRQWLLQGVRSTDAEFVFVVSSVAWNVFHTAGHVGGSTDPKGDTFGGFLHEREMLLDAFDELPKQVLLLTGDVHNSMSIRVSDNVWEFLCAPMSSTGHPISTAGDPPFGGTFDSEGRDVRIKWTLGFPNNVHYSRQRNTCYGVVQVNNVMKAARPEDEGSGYQWVAYDEPQVVVRFHDGYTGRLLYAEGISAGGAE